jgi:surface glycoprotein (TIGR04207 family)
MSSNRREKISSVFFSAVMVISMLAIGGVAFTGNAAAAANGNVPTSDFTVQAGGVDQAGGGGSITLEDTTDGFDASSGTATIQLPTGSDVTFDQQNSSLAVGGTAVSVSNARF